jgi:sugar lactone lactonase YvrE
VDVAAFGNRASGRGCVRSLCLYPSSRTGIQPAIRIGDLMRSPFGLSSIFAGLLLCLAITAGSACAQITLPRHGAVNTVAGVGTSGYSGDSGQASNAEMYTPQGVAVDASGNIYIADSRNNRIRKVAAPTGIITTVAGTGIAGYSGDSGPAINAQLYTPQGVAVDASGNIYIADSQNNRVRKVTAATGIITTVAGTDIAGYSGDGMLAASAGLNNPSGIAIDASGNIYIADTQNNRVRKVTASTGIITTLAGNGTAGYNGDGILAASAELNGPQRLVVDEYDDVYISDTLNNRIREVGLNGEIATVAGTGDAGYSGDNGQANVAAISHPMGLTMDANGNLFFADAGNARIRMITIYTGFITSVAGNGTASFLGDGGSATDAELNRPDSVAIDANANLYVTDSWNNRVRVVGGNKIVKHAQAVTPMSYLPCSLGGVWLPPGNLPSGSGTWTGSVNYTSYNGCGVTVQSGNDWLKFTSNLQCLPYIVIDGQTVTCTFTFSVTQNNGPGRLGTITMFNGAGSSQSGSVFQDGPPQTLTVSVSGSGTVTSTPSGISCPANCSVGFNMGTIVNLTASPSAGYSFSGWSGACSGTGGCPLTMNSPTNVSATFTPLPTFTLVVDQPSQTTPLSLGHSMTYAVSVSPQYGFTGTVALSVSGLRAGVTAQLSNTSINTAGTATLTLTSAYSNSTFHGTSYITVTGISGSLSKSVTNNLVTQPLQYKGTCGVQ